MVCYSFASISKTVPSRKGRCGGRGGGREVSRVHFMCYVFCACACGAKKTPATTSIKRVKQKSLFFSDSAPTVLKHWRPATPVPTPHHTATPARSHPKSNPISDSRAEHPIPMLRLLPVLLQAAVVVSLFAAHCNSSAINTDAMPTQTYFHLFSERAVQQRAQRAHTEVQVIRAELVDSITTENKKIERARHQQKLNVE